MYTFDLLTSMTPEQRCLYRHLRAGEPVTVRADSDTLFSIVPNRDNAFHLPGYDIMQDGQVKRGLLLDEVALLEWCRTLHEVLPEGVRHDHVEPDLGYALVHSWLPDWRDDEPVPDMHYTFLHEQCNALYSARNPRITETQRVPIAFLSADTRCHECCQLLTHNEIRKRDTL